MLHLMMDMPMGAKAQFGMTLMLFTKIFQEQSGIKPIPLVGTMGLLSADTTYIETLRGLNLCTTGRVKQVEIFISERGKS